MLLRLNKVCYQIHVKSTSEIKLESMRDYIVFYILLIRSNE